MAVPYRVVEMPVNKVNLKCPYPMPNPIGITVHNTANSAPAKNEIAYMHRNANAVSFHIAVDDKEAVQGIALNRNAWHSGDGDGDGNRKTISIEICYSTEYGTGRYEKAEENAVQLIAKIFKERGWTVESNLFKHQDWNGKNCPHRILDEGRWESFKNRIKEAMGVNTSPVQSSVVPGQKDITTLAKEVIEGRWGNGATRKQNLTRAGYDYEAVQAEVNRLLGVAAPEVKSTKTNEQLADEVLTGAWGNGADRRQRLESAGYSYDAVQSIVNAKLGAQATTNKKTTSQLADEIIDGAWGNGAFRKTKLMEAGYTQAEIEDAQAEVNRRLG